MTKPGQPEHTPEPWRWVWRDNGIEPDAEYWDDHSRGFVRPLEIRGADGTILEAEWEYDDALIQVSAADARRIVACVNACNGLGTEELEHCKDIHDLASLLEYGSEVVASLVFPGRTTHSSACLRCGIEIGSGAHYQIDDGFQTGGPYCRSCYEVIRNAKPAP